MLRPLFSNAIHICLPVASMIASAELATAGVENLHVVRIGTSLTPVRLPVKNDSERGSRPILIMPQFLDQRSRARYGRLACRSRNLGRRK